jgi:hypothetical protein
MLGQAAAAHVRLIVWCKACQHRFEPDRPSLLTRAISSKSGGRGPGGSRDEAVALCTALISSARHGVSRSRCNHPGDLIGTAQIDRSWVGVELARPGDPLLSDNYLATFRVGSIELAVRVEPLLHLLAFTWRRYDRVRCGKRQYQSCSIDQMCHARAVQPSDTLRPAGKVVVLSSCTSSRNRAIPPPSM